MSNASGTTLVTEPPGSAWTWAAYLGASWTWCIGMFLPVLLIRDYGPWAWVIFALPNAVGAAAMGWVMRSHEQSRQYTVDHASAGRLFSFVTIAFQLFFSIWMLPRLVGPVGFVGAVALVQSAFTPYTKQSWLRNGGLVVLGISVAIAAIMVQHDVLMVPFHQPFAPLDAAGLLLVCLAGFLTCPYLDLTFHRGRQSTEGAGAKFAFGVGFCVLFFSMIVLTFFYAQRAMRIDVGGNFSLERIGRWLLAIHLFVQMTYTVQVHGAELVRQAEARDDAGVMRSGLGLWLAIGLAAGLGSVFAAQNQLLYHDKLIGEVLYRVFMSFYGLLFPAYVLLAIGRRRVSVSAWLVISAVASPFYWIAFIEGRMAWAIGGVGVLVLGVLAARALKRPAPAVPIE